MTAEPELVMGVVAAVICFVIGAVRTWRSYSLVDELQKAADHGLAQHAAIVGSINYSTGDYTLRSTGRDDYGCVIESVSLGPRYRPACLWCATDLVVDSKGVCAGCGARP